MLKFLLAKRLCFMSLSSPGQCLFFLAVGIAQLRGLNSVFFVCQVNLIAKLTAGPVKSPFLPFLLLNSYSINYYTLVKLACTSILPMKLQLHSNSEASSSVFGRELASLCWKHKAARARTVSSCICHQWLWSSTSYLFFALPSGFSA